MNSYIKLLLFSFILYSCGTPVPQKKKKAPPSPSGISYLNKLRNNLGMISLKTNKKLSNSSKSHARYLTKFGFKDPHVEKYKNSKLFTGHKVKDRVISAGYKTTYSSENITQSPTFDTKYLKSTISKSDQAITDLITAIYHRFTFLDYTFDEIGFGKDSKNYVYNLGNSHLNKLCSKKQSPIRGKFYTNLCSDKGKMIKVGLKKKALNEVIKKNSKDYILFPGPGFKNVHPVFYNEIPDPLPDLNMSGNPISLHFGPHVKDEIIVTNFRLKNVKTNKIVKVRHLNSKNDPNKLFRKNFFAFFPLQRLDWDTKYSARLTYQSCSSCKSKKRNKIFWSFKTRKFKYKTLTIANHNPRPVQIKNGEKVMLYFRPEKLNELNNRFSFKFRYSKNKKPLVKLKAIDSNTVFFQVKNAPPGQKINIFYKVENKKKRLVVKIRA